MRNQQRRMTGRRRFTLIEIAVAMSIFAILMLILMQIFSATQNVWRSSSGKTDAYESARVVLELLGNGLENAIKTNASTGEKFYYNKTNSELWFPTMTTIRLDSSAISGEAEYYFKLDIPSGQTLGTLKFGYAKDTSVSASTNLDFRTNSSARSTLDTGTGSNLVPMLDNVQTFSIEAFSKDSTGQLQYINSNTISDLPAAVIVTLKVLDNDERTITRFKNAATNADRDALLRTFRRIIYVNATN